MAETMIKAAIELDAYQKLAEIYLSLTESGIIKARNMGELEEVF